MAMEPSVEEKNLYFSGLPSCPRLVARSNFDVTFTPGNGGIFWPVKKFLWPASPNHPIVALWDGPLRQAIINALDGINWTAIDIIRLGFHKNPDRPEQAEPELPHVLLVSVVNTTWRQGFQAVISCRRILESYGLDDIHCEMKDSVVERSTSTSTPSEVPPLASPRLISQSEEPPLYHPNIHHRHFVSENLGVLIAPFNNPRQEGTKGLYLRRKDTGAILALTCRHVVCDPSKVPNEPYQHNPDITPWVVIQPGSASLDTMLDLTSEQIDTELDTQFRLANNFSHTEENRQRLLTGSQNRLAPCMPWRHYLQTLTAPESRIIGHVLCSPKVSPGKSPSGANRLRDWALIELHPNKHQTELPALRNTVPVSSYERMKINSVAREETPRSRPSLNYDGRLVTLEGFITEDQIKNPTTKDSDNNPHMVVAMYGRTSNLSIGFSNVIMSIKREVIKGKAELSEEWCILGRKDDSSMGSKPFSIGGDSGSCIWDMEGRVAGLLMGGNKTGHYGVNDITYAHPIEWVLADIRTEFGIDVELV